jgi:hypothetical protein
VALGQLAAPAVFVPLLALLIGRWLPARPATIVL